MELIKVVNQKTPKGRPVLGKSSMIDTAEEAESVVMARRPTRYHRNSADEFIVTVLAAERIPQEIIAKALNRPWGLSVETMIAHYPVELLAAKVSMLVLAYNRLLREIGNGTLENPGTKAGVRAAMFLINRIGGRLHKPPYGLSEKRKVAVNTGNGHTITFETTKAIPERDEEGDS